MHLHEDLLFESSGGVEPLDDVLDEGHGLGIGDDDEGLRAFVGDEDDVAEQHASLGFRDDRFQRGGCFRGCWIGFAPPGKGHAGRQRAALHSGGPGRAILGHRRSLLVLLLVLRGIEHLLDDRLHFVGFGIDEADVFRLLARDHRLVDVREHLDDAVHIVGGIGQEDASGVDLLALDVFAAEVGDELADVLGVDVHEFENLGDELAVFRIEGQRACLRIREKSRRREFPQFGCLDDLQKLVALGLKDDVVEVEDLLDGHEILFVVEGALGDGAQRHLRIRGDSRREDRGEPLAHGVVHDDEVDRGVLIVEGVGGIVDRDDGDDAAAGGLGGGARRRACGGGGGAADRGGRGRCGAVLGGRVEGDGHEQQEGGRESSRCGGVDLHFAGSCSTPSGGVFEAAGAASRGGSASRLGAGAAWASGMGAGEAAGGVWAVSPRM